MMISPICLIGLVPPGGLGKKGGGGGWNDQVEQGEGEILGVFHLNCDVQVGHEGER